MKTYLTNCEYIQGRDADYRTRDEVLSKFEAIPLKEGDMGGTCGNVASYAGFNAKTKKAKFNKDWSQPDGYVPLYQAIPSALALYRLCTTFETQVKSYGPTGYKCTWSMAVRHLDSGQKIFFGEHKGAFSFWTRHGNASDLPDDLRKDLALLLTYLVSDTCAHPYDGLIAGSVA